MKKTALCLLSLFLTGCASSYEPVVDMKGVSTDQYQQDLSECRAYAEKVDVAGNTAEDTGIGALVGAAGGAVLGALSGNPAGGALTGTAVGGLAGAGGGVLSNTDRQKAIINNCLKGRGYKILG